MNRIKKGPRFSHNNELPKNECFGDTALSLNCFGYGGSSSTSVEGADNSLKAGFSNASDDSCKLVLGLGPPLSAYFDDCYSFGVNKNKGLASGAIFPKGLLSESDSILKLGLSGGAKEALSSLDCSVEGTDTDTPLLNQISGDDIRVPIPVVDEGSTSAKKCGGYMASLLLAPRMDVGKALSPLSQTEALNFGTRSHHQFHLSNEISAIAEFSMGTTSEQAISSTSSDHRTKNLKKCKFFGCSKGARGASGLCIGHGGGQRCLKPGCNKGAESRTAYCKAHGGGRRCEHLGCTKSAEGKTEYCIAHGGGRRCGFPGGCTKAARGKSGLCIRHGGGKRCKVEGCSRSAEGQAGLCISHGGGRRCLYQACMKGAQGSTMFCKAHGGGKRCIFAGCTKGAEGSTPLCKGHGGGKRCLFDGGGICPKSVHGGTNFCVAHGGGKRCVVSDCTKSARGRTDYCVRHGGGKRCKSEDCGKSAQGSTDFCKAHGGGKRCTWGEGKCEKFARGKSGLCAAHSSMGRERTTNKTGLIGPGLFHGLVSASSVAGSSIDNNHSYSGVSAVSDSIDSLEKPAERQHLIPPQVLVPLSMKASSSYTGFMNTEKPEEGANGYADSNGGIKSYDYLVPEGRVHGGGLMSSFYGGNLKSTIDGV
ncbi:hypothetical protein OIU79_007794 [Salix purpurea]|uniref:WRKY19-like zinc finger domain-containing protein n=1 Tax=Salix purpurea TaxID=77065 RepID=A0A9Q0TGU0_SALPP|nr:hypothetical protein OIU79_007794 [Salix purpurea]KAJ6711414.1 hypothetical protein OIU79_007794 [Salix purpurea]